MMGNDFRLRGVYGKPWSKMAGEIPLTPAMLDRIGEIIVESVVEEARKDFAKQGRSPTPRGQPEGIPSQGSFFESFSHQLRGKSTIEIVSSWPWVEQIIEGRPPYPMKWLTRAAGVHKVPMVQPDGTVLVRTTPLRLGDAWIHPGFARHTFLERGVRKGREKAVDLVVDVFMDQLMKGDPTR